MSLERDNAWGEDEEKAMTDEPCVSYEEGQIAEKLIQKQSRDVARKFE